MSDFNIPTEVVELPSKGLCYPKSNPLSEGEIEMKYMSAREEDILTNQSYIEKGNVLDKLLQSMIVSEINYDDLVVGDKNALLVAARVLGYGAKYEFNWLGNTEVVDLSTLEPKEIDYSLYKNSNELEFTLPHTGINITFKILTVKDIRDIDDELEGMKKISKNVSAQATTRLKYIITSIEGNNDKKNIREYVDQALLAKDSRELRKYIAKTQPDINLSYINDDGEEAMIPLGINFFWPDA